MRRLTRSPRNLEIRSDLYSPSRQRLFAQLGHAWQRPRADTLETLWDSSCAHEPYAAYLQTFFRRLHGVVTPLFLESMDPVANGSLKIGGISFYLPAFTICQATDRLLSREATEKY